MAIHFTIHANYTPALHISAEQLFKIIHHRFRIVRITCDRLCAWLSEHGQHRVAI